MRANAIYTGGGIWLFLGETEEGNYFLMDDYGSVRILTEDPSEDLDESLMPEWQEERLVRDLDGRERIDFGNAVLDYLLSHPDCDGGMTEEEIERYRGWFEEEL